MHVDDYHFGTVVIEGRSYQSDLMICGEELYQKWRRRQGHHLCLEDLEWMLQRNFGYSDFLRCRNLRENRNSSISAFNASSVSVKCS